jgi:hypothetical protein
MISVGGIPFKFQPPKGISDLSDPLPLLTVKKGEIVSTPKGD